MAKLTGSQIVIECLVEQGVDTVFGYPGGAILNIYDELYKNQERIHHILTAHEQAAAHAADGYARSTGKVGVCMATSGPGATNLVTGIATAYMDSIPMVAITCNVPTNQLGKDSFQEIDICGVTMPITKHNYIVRDVKDLADTIREAFMIARSGRPGPVLIDIPKDVTANSTEYTAVPGGKIEISDKKNISRIMKFTSPKDEDVQKLADLINKSEKPFIYAGGGVTISDSCEVLKALAEKANIPVAVSLMGKACFPNSHELCCGMIGMHGTKVSNYGADRSDLLLCIGTRFSDRVIGDAKKFCKHSTIVQIDIDPAEVNKMVNVDNAFIGDVKELLEKVLPLVNAKRNDEWLKQIAEWKAEVPASYNKKEPLNPKFIYDYARKASGEDTIITTEVGQHQMWAAQWYNCEKPRTFLSSGGLGTMGYGTGAAMGAQFGNPDKRVVAFAGDGSFRMNCNELATVGHYNLPIVFVIVNNGALGNVRMWQTLFYNKHYSNTTLDFGPDFVKLAEAYGIKGYRATTEEEFKKAFDEAFALKAPVLIDAQIYIDEFVLPMIAPGKSIDHMIMDVDLN